MKVFKFLNKKQARTYLIMTCVCVVLTISIFLNLDIHVNTSDAFLVASILSYISIMIAVKKASTEIEEIIIDNDVAKIYFFNKKKKSLLFPISEISLKINGEKVEFFKSTDELIGVIYKNRMEQPDQWDDLILIFQKASDLVV